MKALNCLKLAHAADLSNVGEAYYNIRLHWANLFLYSEVDDEITELLEDFYHYGLAEKSIKPDGEMYEVKANTSLNEALAIINKADGTNHTFED